MIPPDKVHYETELITYCIINALLKIFILFIILSKLQYFNLLHKNVNAFRHTLVDSITIRTVF
jgi:hypothetical protein